MIRRMSRGPSKAARGVGRYDQDRETGFFLKQVPVAVGFKMSLPINVPITKCLAGIGLNGDNNSIQFLLT